MAARLTPVIGGLALMALMAGRAGAVSKDELTVTLDPDDAINIANCSPDKLIKIKGEFTGSDTDFELRITANTSNSACDTSDTCDDDGDCKCFLKSTSKTLEVERSLRQLVGPDVCDGNDETNVYVFVQYFKDGEGDDNDTTESKSTSLRIDLSAPAAPSTPPSVVAAESAVEVSLTKDYFANDINEDEVDKIRICAVPSQQAGSTFQPVESDSDTRCRTITVGPDEVKQTKFRLEGLTNAVTYRVGYAEIDGAGNVGAYSPTTEATPADVQDFAEYYEEICVRSLNGDTTQVSNECEGGGCSATPASTSGLVLLGMGLLLGLGRRRKGA